MISADNGLKIDGMEEVRAKIARLENPAEFFDDDVFDTRVFALKKLIKETNFDKFSGLDHTKNMWKAKKLEDSLHQIDNVKTSDPAYSPSGTTYSIAAIINYGRKEVRPVRAKRLYIPRSRKAKNRAKPYGAPIPKDFEYGWDKDFILAKKSKAVKGTGFIQNTEEEAEELLVDKIVKRINGEFK